MTTGDGRTNLIYVARSFGESQLEVVLYLGKKL